MNILGAIVFNKTISGINGTERVDAENFTKGIYFVKIYDGDTNYTKKIVISNSVLRMICESRVESCHEDRKVSEFFTIVS